jgi:hypothetical protein
MARALRVVVPVLVLLFSTRAMAQEMGSGSSERPRGFSIEVGVAASTAFYSLGALGGGFSSFALTPELGLGAQLGRLSLALNTSISMTGDSVDSGADEHSTSVWTVRLGPYVDGEIWSSGRIALFLFGGVDVLVFSRKSDLLEDDLTAPGFSIDVGLGGRIYVLPQFPIGLKVGSTFDMVLWDEGDVENRSMAWSIYGALAFRFVASR